MYNGAISCVVMVVPGQEHPGYEPATILSQDSCGLKLQWDIIVGSMLSGVHDTVLPFALLQVRTQD